MRRLLLIVGAIAIVAVPVTLATAQTSVPTVAVSLSGSTVVLNPSGPIGAGPTRFTFDGRGEFNLATLRAGVSVDELRQSLSNPRSVRALGQVFIEAAVVPGRPVTVDLRPNTTYVAVVIAGRTQALTTFTTREASSTWTTPCVYSGATFTAVCAGLVVAPPMSRGTVKF